MAGWDLVDVWKDSQESPSLSKKLQNISSMELLLGEKTTVVTKLKEFFLPGFYFCFKCLLVCAWRPPLASKPRRGSMERWDGARCSCPAPPRCCSWSISPSLCRSIFHSSERCEIWGFLHKRKCGKEREVGQRSMWKEVLETDRAYFHCWLGWSVPSMMQKNCRAAGNQERNEIRFQLWIHSFWRSSVAVAFSPWSGPARLHIQ